MKKSEKIDYEKAYKLARENEKMSRRQEKQQQIKDKRNITLEINLKKGEDEQSKGLSSKDKIICAVDGTSCNGRCREKNEINGELQCGEAIKSNKKRKRALYDF